MSLETDVGYAVNKMVAKIKERIEENLKLAVGKQMLTIEEQKIPGIAKLMKESVDQGFVQGTELLSNTLRAYSSKK